MALPSSVRLYLFFRVFFAGLSDPWTHRTGGNSTGWRVSARRGKFAGLRPRVVVCAHIALAGERLAYADCPVLDRHGRGAPVGSECVVARNAGDLFYMLSFVRDRGTGL